jgi:hypothetical protein
MDPGPKRGSVDEGLVHLVRFVKRKGHARVPQAWRQDDYRLGQRVAVQRVTRAGNAHSRASPSVGLSP